MIAGVKIPWKLSSKCYKAANSILADKLENNNLWWKMCGWISLGRGAIRGLQELWYALWQAPHTDSQENTHFQHKAVSFITMVKVLPTALLGWLCNVCCTVLLLCKCWKKQQLLQCVSQHFSKGTGREYTRKKIKKKKIHPPKCVSSQDSNLTPCLSWPRWFYILQGKTGLLWPLRWTMHETRLVTSLRGL